MSAATAETTVMYEGFWRFPNLSKRWKSVGVFATEVEASAAIDEALGGRTYRVVDRWVHRLDPHAPKKQSSRANKTLASPEAAA